MDSRSRAHLDAITNEMYSGMKKVLTRSLKDEESKAKGTNAPPTSAEKKIE